MSRSKLLGVDQSTLVTEDFDCERDPWNMENLEENLQKEEINYYYDRIVKYMF